MNLQGNRGRRTRSWCLAVLGLLCGGYLSVQTGSANPILVLTNAANPFNQYYAQILLTEGLNGFAQQDISSVSNETLAEYDVVILGQMALTAPEVTMLSDWVSGGGNLIAMRPDKQLAGLLGLSDVGSTLSEGYLLVNTASGPGAGIVGQTMQFHGTADRYTLDSAASLATLYTDVATATTNPAVTLRSVGSNGGHAAAFTFDLAQSIVYMRQGNPAWAGQDRDGFPPVRSDDLFYGAATNDMQPDWIDFNRVIIPQADEQQRFLANLIVHMNFSRKPLPRFWYFPRGHEAVVVMTGDNHGYSGVAGRFDQYVALSPTNGSVVDWETIRATAYIFTNLDALTDAQAAAYEAAGFEIALHLDTGCADYDSTTLEAMLTDQFRDFTNLYPSVLPVTTHRMHCIAWSGYTILPEGELLHGIRLDLSYYYWPSNWVLDRPGFFTGSAMPMRFSTTNGNILDVYQAATQMTDESGQTYPSTVDALLGRAVGPEKYYGAYVANMHMDAADSAGSDAIVQSAMSRGIPIISARQLLTWLDGRNGCSITSVTMTNNTLNFAVTTNAAARGLQGMVPIRFGYNVTNINHNGSPISYSLKSVKGIQYAVFSALTGNYQVDLTSDTSAPVVTTVLPHNGATRVSLTTNVVATFSEEMLASTINTNTVFLLNSTNGVVPATVSYNASQFVVVLTPNAPLALGSDYTATVKGGAGGVTDSVGNPLAGDFVWSFSTDDRIIYSIWPDSATPAILSANDVNAIEVGVKFQSVVNGSVDGIRFYKSSDNTGPHVGSLWTSTGTLLASVTFSNETAFGWQYQAFVTPAAITSNTTYIASYHAPLGKYSANAGYFSGSGVTNYPLWALPDGLSGGNGVYTYSATSAFPTDTYGGANYWVDLVFQSGEVPLSIANSSLPNGFLNVTYSATLAGSGGAPPYSWSIVGGSLPPGLTLNADTGEISGTPTNSGTFSFTVQVTDSNSPAKTASKLLSITVPAVSVGLTIWPGTTVPGTIDSGPDTAVELGVKFSSDVFGKITGIRFYKAALNTGTHVGSLWTTNGTLLASAAFVGETASGWQQVDFETPVDIDSNTVYVASYHANDGHFSIDTSYFASAGVDNPPLHALANSVAGGNGIFSYGSTGTFPSNSFNAANYWVDVVFVCNTAPILPTQTDRTIAELTLLTVTNTASDADLPANVLSYQLLEAPVGAAIDSNGVITWTPNQSQSPSTNTIRTLVTDDGVPPLSATNVFTVIVREVNLVPVLPVQPDQVVDELSTMTVTNAATEPNIHSVTAGYGLINPPAGAAIDANGIITWTPSQSQSPSTNVITTVVTNSNPYDAINPQLTATNSFTVIVREVNLAPVLPVQPDRIVDELTTLTVTNTATEPNIHSVTIGYGLISAPAGASIDGNGIITWTPSQLQSPSTNLITTVITNSNPYDLIHPQLTATNSFTVIVREVNLAPVLPVQPDRFVDELATLTVTNTATEPNIHSVTISYGLISPPAGANISSSGVITWTPSQLQSPSTNVITTVVTNSNPYDLMHPQLTTTNSFTVIVREVNLAPVLPVQPDRSVNELTTLTVTNTATEPNIHSVTIGYGLISAPAGAAIDANGIITWTPTELQSPSTNVITTVVTNSNPYDAINPQLTATNSFTVIVREVNLAPVLPAQPDRIVDELTTLTVTNTATEPNIHSVTIGYGLIGAPAGASIDGNGIITWTPSQLQSPSTNLITTVITNSNPYDLIHPQLTATNSFTVIVREVNLAPVLPVQPDRVVDALTTMTVTNTATEPNIHSVTISYGLISPPAGANISSSGVITWTPSQFQSPSTNVITTVVTNSNPYDVINPQLTATNSFKVVVGEVNMAPVLPVQPDRIVDELTTLTVTNTAAEPNIHSVTIGYGLISAPAGAAIDGNGIITWTPTALQSPSTNVITTVVTNSNPYDVINPQLTATNSFTVTVREVNLAPVLAVQPDRVVDALTTMTVTNTATEPNIHSVTIGYVLVSPPAGANISSSGVITWTPSQLQSPSTNVITTVVTNSNPYDLIHPQLTATNSFTVIVREVNLAPVLPVQPDRVVDELTPLTVTNTATEPNIHSVTIGYVLVSPPAGANISSSGVITWTPSQLQSPSTNVITTVVTNSNPYDLIHPQLTATNSFTVIVREVNLAPVLPVQIDRVVNELTTLTVTNTATEPNIHSVTIGYGLISPPAGASIDGNGIITWTPSQLQSPSTNLITTVITNSNPYDLVNPQLRATNSFTVIVREVNLAPVLPVQPDRIVDELTTLTVTNTATEPNIHSLTIGYGLINPPAGATISASGVITWTPSQLQSPGTNVITAVVTNSNPYDLIHPQLTTTNSFTVIVREVNLAPVLPVQPDRSVNELTTLTVTNAATEPNIHSVTIGYVLVSPPAGANISSSGVITWTPSQLQSPSTNVITTVVTNSNPYDLINPQLRATNSFTVIVGEVNMAPVLPAQPDRVVDELTTLTVTNTATEPNIHSVTIGYGLISPPAGASIDGNGIITWTPSQLQSPSTNVITTMVLNYNPYDPLRPQLTATNSLTVIVREVNMAPVLPVQPDRSVDELTTLTVTNTATEPNIHSVTIGYGLISPPAGASINSSGVITWTPSQLQSPSTNVITTVVTNSDPYDLVHLQLTATNSFTVIVREVNMAPVLPAQGKRTIDELTLLTVTNTASEPNIHSVTIGYGLINPPAGASINSSGVITWTPSQLQSPSSNVITTVVTNSNPYDLIHPQLTTTNSFTVIVREVNLAPVLPVQIDRVVDELTTLTVTNTATEPNIHSVTIGYGLINPPAGATIDANGIITWTPSQSQSPSTNVITTVVTNNNPYDVVLPQLTATNSFTVIVGVVNMAPVLPVQPGRIVDELTILTVTNTASEPNIHSVTIGYGLVNPPAGASIDANGIITWTPSQLQSPTTNVMTTIVTNSNPYDLISPQLTATNSFIVIVREVNLAPVLAVQPGRIVNELTTLTVTNTATEPNIHSVTIGYGLINPPAGATISASGVITWTPNQFQSPSTNVITTVVTNSNPYDLVHAQLTTTNSFTVIVSEVNMAPVLPAQVDRIVNDLTTMTVTNTAAEPNIHSITIGYGLVNPPAGASINSSGVITWTPSEVQSLSTNVITTVVTNHNPFDLINPQLRATNSFTVIVREVNLAPVLPVQPDRIVDELTTLTVTNTASEPNLHSTTTGYGLINPPSGAAIDANGIITWTPSQLQSPSTNAITTVVTNSNPYDLVHPQLTATNSFTVIVREVNLAPVLPAQSSRTIDELALLSVTNTASEPNIHSVTIGYGLINPPVGATINSSGVITWSPSQGQSPSTNVITTVVTNSNPYDLINPQLRATNSFTVIVREVNMAPVLAVQPDRTVDELTTLTVTNTASEPNVHSTTIGYGLINPPAGASINSSGVITWTPSQLQSLSTNVITTVVTNHNPYDLNEPQLKATNSFTVVVREVNMAPVLPVQVGRVVDELTTMTVTNTATEPNIYSVTIGYGLISPPAGAAIDASGIITWTPSQLQSPSTNVITTLVINSDPYDLVHPQLTATNSFTVIVREMNLAPVLAVQPDRIVDELTTLTVTNTATEPNIHSVTIGYGLINPPAGASINSSGVITWTPSQLQSPSTNVVTTVVTNGNPYDLINPQLTTTNSFTVIVREVNIAPVLPAQPDQMVDELTTLTVTNAATEPNIHSVTIGYGLINPPAGATISASGVITWMPGQLQSPSTNVITTVVTNSNPYDLINPQLRVTNRFAVVVREVNMAPVLPVQAGRIVDGLTTMTVTNTATEPNIHSVTMGYGLINPPGGASINSSGVITWTPSQLQSPSTNVITTVVTNGNPYDLINPQLRATNSFTVIVREVNLAPVLPVQPDRIVDELTAMTVTNTATEPNIHSVTIGYGLINPPAGATISASGVITWTPSQLQSPSTNVITTVVTNSNPYDLIRPQLTATNSFTVIVREVNLAPVLPVQIVRVVDELTTMTVTNTATEPNIHSVTIGYGLINPPAGATINANGIITWTPSQSQSLSTNVIVSVVTNSNPYDLIHPQLTASNSFTVIVGVVNMAPVLPAQPDRIVDELTTMTVTNTAGEPNIHSVTIGYGLINPPAGVTISSSGVITWTPSQLQSPSTNVITTVVTNSNPSDLINPRLRATNSFTVIVREVNMAAVLPVQPGQIVDELTTLIVTNTASEPNIHSVTIGYGLINPPAGVTVNSSGVITWTPSQLQSPSTNVITTVVTNSNPYDLINPQLRATNSFTVIVREVNLAPVLPAQSNRTIDELTLLTVTNAAGEPNMHSATIGYGLINPPAGASINSSGVITWTPSQLQSPSTNVITTVVTNSNPYDLINPQLRATNSFTVIVREVNIAPVLPVQPGQIVDELTTLSVTNTASEPNIHSVTIGYGLINPPAGATINSSGMITWTPSQLQSPSTNVITTVVTNSNPYDLINPQLRATNSFTVIVREVNLAPVLPVQTDRIVDELSTLTVTNTASEPNIHSVTIGYGLINPPIGATINSSGVITWTPSQSQSPGTNVITTVVINSNPHDLVHSQLTATNSFTVIVREVNMAPVLPVQADRVVDELTTLTVTNTASEPNVHSTTFGYRLISPPSGAAIDANGIITWTPSQLQSPSTNVITTVVTNGNPYDLVHPQLTATNSFTVIVREVNLAPVLPVQIDRVVDELTTLTVTNSATEPNIHSVTIGYRLINPPTGATIDANGIITWTPSQSQSPSTNVIRTVVTNSNPYDLIHPQLTATNSFTVIVGVVNMAPVLPMQTARTIDELTLLIVTNTATEPNLHSVTIGYGLINPPAGASIDINGIITWTPSQSQSPSTNLITTVVTNNNPHDPVNPRLTATNSFTVIVREVNLAPVLPVQMARVVDVLTTMTVINTATESNIHSVTIGYRLVNPPAGATISSSGVITWTPSQLQSPSTNVITTVVTNSNPYDLTHPQLTATNSFTAIVRVVNMAPVLPAQMDRVVDELTTVIITNTATEPNIHSVTIGYRLVNSPAGATIAGNGIITWTPSQLQSPSTNVITTVVTNNNPYDLINPQLTATNSVVVYVGEVNLAPLLPAQADHTIDELTLLIVTNTASEPDIHSVTIGYGLINPPAGATIDANGIITWTPSQVQSPSTNMITTVVTNSNPYDVIDPQLRATNSFMVMVREVNRASVLPVQTDRTITELTRLIVTNSATEPNIHSVTLGYGLVNPPAGASIDTNGVITWTPTEAQGPATNIIMTVVTNRNPFDAVNPQLTATNSFVVIVAEQNAAPTLPVLGNRTVPVLTMLIVTNTAASSDIPPKTLRYALIDPPAGASIDANGIIRWTPAGAQGPGTHTITTEVSDDGAPPLSARNSFTVTVLTLTNSPVAGMYQGLFYDTNGVAPQSSGFFQAKVTRNGAFSAKMRSGRNTYSLSGQFLSSGSFAGSIVRKNLTPLSAQLQVDLAGGNIITGQISDGNWTAELAGCRAIYNAKTNPAPQSGYYTLLIPGAQAASSKQPGGDSPATVKVSSSGKVKFAAALADGSKASQAAFVFQNGQWPLYASLYSGNGLLIGWLTFTNDVSNDLSGLVCWIKPPQPTAKFYPAGFTNETVAVGSRYAFTMGAPILNFNRGQLLFENGNLADIFTSPIIFETQSRATGENTSLSIWTSSGVFIGSLLHPTTGAKVSFTGVILQKQNSGYGYFLGTDQSGRVFLGP